jgi:hypothetical protein
MSSDQPVFLFDFFLNFSQDIIVFALQLLICLPPKKNLSCQRQIRLWRKIVSGASPCLPAGRQAGRLAAGGEMRSD